MLQQLINHNADINRLYEEGYEIDVIDGYLLVHHIPYVNSNSETKFGSLVCILTFASGTRLGRPQDHTIYFRGETPCETDGKVLSAIIYSSNAQQLTPSILINHYFSSKPKIGYHADYYEKISTYAEILTSQAMAIDKTLTSRPNKQDEKQSTRRVSVH